MKTSFERLKPRVINYRNHKSFENEFLREELYMNYQIQHLREMQMVLKSLKNSKHHTPTKLKYVRGNHLPYTNKTLSESIMHVTRFCSKYLKIKLPKAKESIQSNEITVSHY